jgi:putative transposase
MTTYTDINYHLVFGTKHRVPALEKSRRDDLYRFIWGLMKARNCHLYRIGGVEDHVHILTSLHPTVALADLIKEIKTASSSWIKGQRVFPQFENWQDGYGAFTVSAEARPGLIDYIKNQEAHHAPEGAVSAGGIGRSGEPDERAASAGGGRAGQEAGANGEDFVTELRRLVIASHLEWKPEYLP